MNKTALASMPAIARIALDKIAKKYMSKHERLCHLDASSDKLRLVLHVEDQRGREKQKRLAFVPSVSDTIRIMQLVYKCIPVEKQKNMLYKKAS